MNIFIAKNGQQQGPYTLEQIQGQVASGTLQPTDMAWQEGLAGWVPLTQIPGYRPAHSPLESVPLSGPPPYRAPRPILATVISIFYFIATPFGILSLALIPLLSSGAIPLNAPQHHFYASLNMTDHLLTLLLLLLNLSGAILLFKMRRPAVYCFGAVVVVNILNYARMILFRHWLEAVSNPLGATPIFIGAFIGIGITVAVFIYVRRLGATNALR